MIELASTSKSYSDLLSLVGSTVCLETLNGQGYEEGILECVKHDGQSSQFFSVGSSEFWCGHVSVDFEEHFIYWD